MVVEEVERGEEEEGGSGGGGRRRGPIIRRKFREKINSTIA